MKNETTIRLLQFRRGRGSLASIGPPLRMHGFLTPVMLSRFLSLFLFIGFPDRIFQVKRSLFHDKGSWRQPTRPVSASNLFLVLPSAMASRAEINHSIGFHEPIRGDRIVERSLKTQISDELNIDENGLVSND